MTVVKLTPTREASGGKNLKYPLSLPNITGVLIPFDQHSAQVSTQYLTKDLVIYPLKSTRNIPGAELTMVLVGDGTITGPTFGDEFTADPDSDAYDETFGTANVYTLKHVGSDRYIYKNQVDANYRIPAGLAPRPVVTLDGTVAAELTEIEPGVINATVVASDMLAALPTGAAPFTYAIKRSADPSSSFAENLVVVCDDVPSVLVDVRVTDDNGAATIESTTLTVNDTFLLC
jgi:hypothetical protein